MQPRSRLTKQFSSISAALSLSALTFAVGPGLSSVALAGETKPAQKAEASRDGKDAPKALPVAEREPDAAEIGRRVQAFYDRTKSFRAAFDQRYQIKATGVEKKSSGEVIFEKPGKMSWRYTTNGNRVVSDGKIIRVYERNARRMFESEMGKSPYPAALAFLVGDGNLNTAFSLKKLDAKQLKFEGGWVLEATPKDATPAYKTMILYVDSSTAQVRRVLLLDAQGNRNRFDFAKPSVNAKVQTGEFTFAPPDGTQVVRQ